MMVIDIYYWQWTVSAGMLIQGAQPKSILFAESNAIYLIYISLLQKVK